MFLSVMLWWVAWWKFWQEGHVSHPPGVKWWQELVQGLVALSEALCCPPRSPELSGWCSFLLWKSRIWTWTYQVSKDAFWKSSSSPAHGRSSRAMVWGGPRVSAGGGWAKLQVCSHRFSQNCLCFAGCVCLRHRELSGPVRIPDLSPVHWSAAAAPCESLGGSGKCLLCVSHERKEPRGAEKHPQHPAGVEAAQNEVQSPKMTCRPLKGSWEDCWALNQYPCSVIYRTGHIYGHQSLDWWHHGARFDLLNHKGEFNLFLEMCCWIEEQNYSCYLWSPPPTGTCIIHRPFHKYIEPHLKKQLICFLQCGRLRELLTSDSRKAASLDF